MYNYSEQKKKIFTEDGQVIFLEVRDKAQQLLDGAGAFRLQELMTWLTGDSWTIIACVDRLVELGEIREIPQGKVMGQDRVFVKNNSRQS